MKAKNVLDKLKDLKLRRWGPAEYTEAKNSNRGGGENNTNVGNVFFPPLTIQPSKVEIQPLEGELIIKNANELTYEDFADEGNSVFFEFSKESIVNSGLVSAADLEALPIYTRDSFNQETAVGIQLNNDEQFLIPYNAELSIYEGTKAIRIEMITDDLITIYRIGDNDFIITSSYSEGN